MIRPERFAHKPQNMTESAQPALKAMIMSALGSVSVHNFVLMSIVGKGMLLCFTNSCLSYVLIMIYQARRLALRTCVGSSVFF